MSQKNETNHLLGAARGLLMLLIFLTPLFFLPVTLEVLELNKQTLLLLLTCAAAVCWLASLMHARRITLVRGWTNLLPWLLVLAFAIPAIFSTAPYLSWVGAHRQEYTSVLTMVALAVLFTLLANTMGHRREHRSTHLILLVSTSLVVLVSVLETVGVSVVSGLAPSLTLSTIGTPTTLAAWLVVLSSFFLGAFLAHRHGDSLLHDGLLGRLEVTLMSTVLAGTFFMLLLVDDARLWALLAISLALLFVFVVFRAKDFPHQTRLLVPLLLLIGALLFWFALPGPASFPIPLEVTPNTAGSQLVAQRTLQATSSSWGSGPGTYTFDYSQFHDGVLNQTDFWNTRFDRAASFVLTLVPTIGVWGMTLLGLFVALLMIRSIAQVLRPASRDEWLESFVHFVPWFTLFVSAFVVPWNMTLMVSFGIFSGLLASQVMRHQWHRSLARAPGVTLVIATVLVSLALAFLVGIFVTSQRYMAEIAFTRAVELDRTGGDLQDVLVLLDRASTLNRYHDTYYRNLGEALLLRVEEELAQVSSLDTLTPESSQYVSALTAASVNAVARASALSPNNVLNWLSRGQVYRELIPVLGEASEFAVESYLRATELEPINPANWTQLGMTYLAAAEQVRPLTASPDVATAQQARSSLDQFLGNAQLAFETATKLKPTYAPAHFQLAMTFERQGHLDEAISKMQSVAQYNQLDVGVHFQLGMLYLQRDGAGDRDRAQEAFERAVNLAPNYANAHWFLASIFEQEGDLAAAVREVEVVLALNPGNEIVESRLERLLKGQITSEVPEAIEE